jgi:hypothetical protein
MKASDSHLGVIPDLATHAVDGAVDYGCGHAARPGGTPRSNARPLQAGMCSPSASRGMHARRRTCT